MGVLCAWWAGADDTQNSNAKAFPETSENGVTKQEQA